MSLFQNFVDVFTNFDPDIFRSLHDEDFMMVRQTELSTLDEHCEIINALAVQPEWDWHIKAELIHENKYVLETRWHDGDEIVTNVNMIKNGKCWRSIISRVPISQRD